MTFNNQERVEDLAGRVSSQIYEDSISLLSSFRDQDFLKKNNLNEHVRADTAGSAEMISRNKKKHEAAIASSLSAKTYGLETIVKNIEY